MQQCSCGGAGCKLCKARQAPKLFLPVEPMGAVRTTQRQKFVDEKAQRYYDYKQVIQLMAMSRLQRIPAGKAIIIKDLVFYMPIPKSGKVSRKDEATGKRKQYPVEHGQPHIAKPDIDNLIKGLFDALNGVAWADDNQVYKITNQEKVYGEHPGIEFGIEYLD
jgi:Holliday junction resolvase RusA-like endonuclease